MLSTLQFARGPLLAVLVVTVVAGGFFYWFTRTDRWTDWAGYRLWALLWTALPLIGTVIYGVATFTNDQVLVRASDMPGWTAYSGTVNSLSQRSVTLVGGRTVEFDLGQTFAVGQSISYHCGPDYNGIGRCYEDNATVARKVPVHDNATAASWTLVIAALLSMIIVQLLLRSGLTDMGKKSRRSQAVWLT